MTGRYDPAQRAAAAAISRDHPAWVIMYGPWSRMFCAFPPFAAPPGTVLAAPDPAGLLAAMHRAEVAACHPRQPPPA